MTNFEYYTLSTDTSLFEVKGNEQNKQLVYNYEETAKLHVVHVIHNYI